MYPKRDFATDAMSDDGDNLLTGEHDGKYELFAEVDSTVREEIKDLVFNGEQQQLCVIGVLCVIENPLCCITDVMASWILLLVG